MSNLVIARPAGFSLCTTAILRCVVRASQASRKVRDRVLPAPKTPATARVDLPDRRASASHRHYVSIVVSGGGAQRHSEAGRLGTVLHCAARG